MWSGGRQLGAEVLTKLIIVDVAELSPVNAEFINLEELDGQQVLWRRHSGLPENLFEHAVKRPRVSRYRAAYLAARDSRSADTIISHLPRMTAAVAELRYLTGNRIPHLAFSFNFTELPGKLQRARMKRVFARVDQFCVYTDFEKDVYADAFDIDPTKIKSVSWAQDMPIIAKGSMPQLAAPYVIAIGGEGRDFSTLVAVAQRLPKTHFVVIARPTAALARAPANMTVLYNVPAPVCWQIASSADAVLVPLTGPETCCGHITLVSARLLALPIVTTASQGTSQYTDGFAGTTVVPHADADAFAGAIESLRENLGATKILAVADQQLAKALYDRSVWRDYVTNFLRSKIIK